jgi:hypothetical protein
MIPKAERSVESDETAVGARIAWILLMSDKPKSTEEQVEKIEAIIGSEALGYGGSGREEHSGENSPKPSKSLTDDLADNTPEDLGQ